MFQIVVLVLSFFVAVYALFQPGTAGIVWIGLAIWLAVVAIYAQIGDQRQPGQPTTGRSKGNMPGGGPSPM